MHIRMNWQAISFDWNQVRAFLATAEEGSLSAAARALGLAQPTLGRQVLALEAHLGVTLFERAGRGLVLTPSGRDLLDHVRAMGEAATRIALLAAGQAEGVAGKVCISASDAMATYVLPDLMVDLCNAAPEIHFEILATNSLSDLLRREADIAIRHQRPTEPDLVTRLVREGQGGLYAAPAFFRRYGRPKTVEDLKSLPFIGMTDPARMAKELTQFGLPLSPQNFRIYSENMVAGWELVRRGLGIGIMSDDIARKTPGVEQVVPLFPAIPVQTWLTTHRDVHTSKRIRIVFDFLAEALAR